MNREMKFEVIKAIRLANKDKNIRSIIMTGEGKAFCTGQDLNDRHVDPKAGSVDIGQTLQEEWNPLMETIRKSEKIIVAAINGVVAGAGLSLSLHCDLKLSLPGVKFVPAFCGIGLHPDAGLSHLLARAMGPTRALEFCLFNGPLFSEDLEKMGLINKVTEDCLLMAKEWAQKLAQLPPLSLAQTKKTFQVAMDQSMDEVFKREMVAQRYLGRSKDYAEGVAAFIEKRSPKFEGV